MIKIGQVNTALMYLVPTVGSSRAGYCDRPVEFEFIVYKK